MRCCLECVYSWAHYILPLPRPSSASLPPSPSLVLYPQLDGFFDHPNNLGILSAQVPQNRTPCETLHLLGRFSQSRDVKIVRLPKLMKCRGLSCPPGRY